MKIVVIILAGFFIFGCSKKTSDASGMAPASPVTVDEFKMLPTIQSLDAFVAKGAWPISEATYQLTDIKTFHFKEQNLALFHETFVQDSAGDLQPVARWQDLQGSISHLDTVLDFPSELRTAPNLGQLTGSKVLSFRSRVAQGWSDGTLRDEGILIDRGLGAGIIPDLIRNYDRSKIDLSLDNVKKDRMFITRSRGNAITILYQDFTIRDDMMAVILIYQELPPNPVLKKPIER